MSAFTLQVWAVVASTSIFALLAPDLRAEVPTYGIDFHAISAGGSALGNRCFHVSGTLAQSAPGYSATVSEPPLYSVYAGFWSSIAATGPDQVFFTGFEEC